MGHSSVGGERRNGGGRQRVKLLDGAFGFLLHVGASPMSAFARTCTPHPRMRPKKGYHRSGTVFFGCADEGPAFFETPGVTVGTSGPDLEELSFEELWRMADPPELDPGWRIDS